jgi:capsular polysaccharide biosynthesis protein
MSQQARGLRRSLLIVRRSFDAVGIFAALGLLAGVALALYYPPMFSSQALVDVVFPPSEQAVAAAQAGAASINPALATQMVIASSTPVLESALRTIHPSMSLETLQNRVQVTEVAITDILTIRAEGKTAAQAEDTANAVADSYVATIRNNRGGQVQASVLESANSASGLSLLSRLPIAGVLGALLGALIGAIGAIVFSRGDRRLPPK